MQLVIGDLIGPEQNYAVKGRSIQDNLHLVREILEGIEDDAEAALINLDQSKAFDRVGHQFLARVLETAAFEPEFHKWIERSVRQGCPLSPLLYVLALEPLLRRLRDGEARPALRGVYLTGSVRAKISAYADDITVFVSRRLDILPVKKAVERYEKVTGAKVDFD